MSAVFEFNPFAIYVDLKVLCPRCGTVQHLNIVPPEANLAAETHRESTNSSYEEERCENCGYVFEINLNNGFGGGDGDIANISQKDLLYYNQTFEDDDFWEDIPESVYTDFLDPHVKDIAITIDKIDVLDEEAREILYRSLYAGLIGAFEAYLSDTLISKVMSNDEYKKRFVQNSKQMQETKFSLSQIYKVQDELDKKVIARLQEIIYHNLAVVSKHYKGVLNVEFQPYGELAKCVSIRHDIVHRNGKDKKGNSVTVTKDDVKDLAQHVSDFITDIERQIYENEHPEELAETERVLDEIFGPDNNNEDDSISHQ